MPAGGDARLYISFTEKDTATAVATLQVDADFLEICVRDANMDREYAEADGTDRCSDNERQMTPTIRNCAVTGDIVKSKNAGVLPTWYSSLLNAYKTKAVFTVLYLDDDIATTGAHGWIFSSQCFNFSEDQPLEDVIKNAISLKNCADGQYNPVEVTMP